VALVDGRFGQDGAAQSFAMPSGKRIGPRDIVALNEHVRQESQRWSTGAGGIWNNMQMKWLIQGIFQIVSM